MRGMLLFISRWEYAEKISASWNLVREPALNETENKWLIISAVTYLMIDRPQLLFHVRTDRISLLHSGETSGIKPLTMGYYDLSGRTSSYSKTSESDDVFCSQNLKTTSFWNVAPCSLVDIGWCFGDAYRVHHQADEAVNVSETSVNSYPTARRNVPEGSRLHTSLLRAWNPIQNTCLSVVIVWNVDRINDRSLFVTVTHSTHVTCS
jgi:hypothetical protein